MKMWVTDQITICKAMDWLGKDFKAQSHLKVCRDIKDHRDLKGHSNLKG